MGRLGILFRDDDGKTTQIDTRAWDFAPWVKEKVARAVRNQMILRHEPTIEERTEIAARIVAGELPFESPEAYITRRKAEALLVLLDAVEDIGEVFLGGGLVVLQPKGIDARELPTTLLDEAEAAELRPRWP